MVGNEFTDSSFIEYDISVKEEQVPDSGRNVEVEGIRINSNHPFEEVHLRDKAFLLEMLAEGFQVGF